MNVKKLLVASALFFGSVGFVQAQESKPTVKEPSKSTQVESAKRTPAQGQSLNDPNKHELPTTKNTYEIDPKAAENSKKKHSGEKASRGKK